MSSYFYQSILGFLLSRSAYVFPSLLFLDVGSTNDIGTHSSGLNPAALYHNDNGMAILMFLEVAPINDE